MSGIDNRALGAILLSVVPFTAAVPAYAQSGLELSGRVAVGVDYIDNIDRRATGGKINESEVRGSGNNWGTSLLDAKGFQTLGEFNGVGQLKALFVLETGFDANKGELNGDGSLINRRGYAGLESSRWGTVIIGRDLSLSINTWYIDPFYQQFMSSPTLVRGRNWLDVKDMVAYQSPTWDGWQFQLQLGLGGESDSFNDGRKDAAQVSYTSKALAFYTIYDQRRDDDGRYSSLFSNSRELTTGAVWHLPGWDLYAGYNHLSAGDALAIADGGDGYRKANHYWLGAQWWPTPRWRLQAAGYHVNATGQQNAHATLAVLGTTYNFSDDFFVYASYGRAMNGAGANFSAEVTDDRPASGRDQNAMYFGFVYSFKGAFGAAAAR